MAEKDPVTIAKESVEAFNSGDYEKTRALTAPDGVYEETATNRRLVGVNDIEQAFRGWRTAFPDAKGTITKAFAFGNTAVLEIVWEGTQRGELSGPLGTIPPSGKRVTVKAAQVVTVEGGKIKETHHYFDMFGMLMQIGAMPTPAGVR
jgi:steroid delta-isomerase-like uncharacterized protein